MSDRISDIRSIFVTYDVYVQDLVQKMERGEIRWSSNSNGSYSAVADGAELNINEAPIMARGNDIIFLASLKDGKRDTIIEPQVHISQAPIGVGMRRVCRFISCQEFPRDPKTVKGRENERLRIALNQLYKLVVRQCNPYVNQQIYEAPFDQFLRKVGEFFKKL